MVTVFVDHGKSLMDLIKTGEKDCDVSDLFYRFTLDSIGLIGIPPSLFLPLSLLDSHFFLFSFLFFLLQPLGKTLVL